MTYPAPYLCGDEKHITDILYENSEKQTQFVLVS